MRWVALLAIAALGLPSAAAAQDRPTQTTALQDDGDHAVVLELGGVGSWSRAEGLHPGGSVAVEVTSIEHWLELEIGVSAVRGNAGTEIPVAVLFKKPWRFSPEFEFMIGVGPEVVHATEPERATFWGIATVLDFMFWPRKNVGWYVEPGYEATFAGGATHHGMGIVAGLLIGR
jgi:hypothetical protein